MGLTSTSGGSYEPTDEEVFGVKPVLTPKRRAPRSRRVTENDDFAAFTRRIMAAHGRRIGRGDVEGLRDLAALSRAADEALRMAVRSLKKDGYSWGEIADRLGVTRQAAQQRFGRSSEPTYQEE